MPERNIDVLNRWKWPITVVFSIFATAFLSLGFGWPISPNARFNILQQAVAAESLARETGDAGVRARLDTLIDRTARLNELSEGLARARCRETPQLAANVGLPCRDLLRDQ